MMKHVNFQRWEKISDEFVYYAGNGDGSLVAFVNPPVRDFDRKIWIDSVTGSPGTLIPYLKWDRSVKMFDDLIDRIRFTQYSNRKRYNITD